MPNFKEQLFCDSAEYRNQFLMPIFAVGLSKGAGTMVGLNLQCRSGMAQVVKFVCDNGLNCGEPDLVDAAAEISIEIASVIFDDGVVESAFEDMKKWMIEYCDGKEGIEKMEPKVPKPMPQPPGYIPKRMAKHIPKRMTHRKG